MSPSDPSSLWACPVVLLTLTGPGRDFPLLAPTFEAWIRGADGWQWVRFGDEGDVIGSGDYTRKSLPVVACCTRVSSSIFPHPDADITLTQDQVNVTLADHHYRFAMQAHRRHIGLGMQEEKGRQITFGPDVFAMFPEQGASPLPTDTPLVGEAVMLRPDLWGRARALRGGCGIHVG